MDVQYIPRCGQGSNINERLAKAWYVHTYKHMVGVIFSSSISLIFYIIYVVGYVCMCHELSTLHVYYTDG